MMGFFDHQMPNQWKTYPGYYAFITSAHHYVNITTPHVSCSWIPAFFLIIDLFVSCLRLFRRQPRFRYPDPTSPGFRHFAYRSSSELVSRLRINHLSNT